jgi:CheY-like chemotaxis protein
MGDQITDTKSVSGRYRTFKRKSVSLRNAILCGSRTCPPPIRFAPFGCYVNPVNVSDTPTLIYVGLRSISSATVLATQGSRLNSRDASRGTFTVLHIEDDPSVARSTARLLRLAGYEVISAATRDEVMRYVEVQGLRPDLILTDFHLRTGTSDDIVLELVARLQFKPPTIVLTGVPGQRPEKAKSIADRTLIKPVDFDVLLHEIESLLGTLK